MKIFSIFNHKILYLIILTVCRKNLIYPCRKNLSQSGFMDLKIITSEEKVKVFLECLLIIVNAFLFSFFFNYCQCF